MDQDHRFVKRIPSAGVDAKGKPINVKIPAGVDDKIAASIMLKGMTAWYLIKQTYKVKKGETILVHAAAGGVGQILC